MTRVQDGDGHIHELVRAWLARDGLDVDVAQAQAELAIGADSAGSGQPLTARS